MYIHWFGLVTHAFAGPGGEFGLEHLSEFSKADFPEGGLLVQTVYGGGIGQRFRLLQIIYCLIRSW